MVNEFGANGYGARDEKTVKKLRVADSSVEKDMMSDAYAERCCFVQ